jgi:hypothetical protein
VLFLFALTHKINILVAVVVVVVVIVVVVVAPSILDRYLLQTP